MRSTSTYSTFFDAQMVDDTVGAAYKELATSYERRKQFIDPDVRLSVETRLEVLRHAWTLLLERSPY